MQPLLVLRSRHFQTRTAKTTSILTQVKSQIQLELLSLCVKRNRCFRETVTKIFLKKCAERDAGASACTACRELVE